MGSFQVIEQSQHCLFISLLKKPWEIQLNAQSLIYMDKLRFSNKKTRASINPKYLSLDKTEILFGLGLP